MKINLKDKRTIKQYLIANDFETIYDKKGFILTELTERIIRDLFEFYILQENPEANLENYQVETDYLSAKNQETINIYEKFANEESRLEDVSNALSQKAFQDLYQENLDLYNEYLKYQEAKRKLINLINEDVNDIEKAKELVDDYLNERRQLQRTLNFFNIFNNNRGSNRFNKIKEAKELIKCYYENYFNNNTNLYNNKQNNQFDQIENILENEESIEKYREILTSNKEEPRLKINESIFLDLYDKEKYQVEVILSNCEEETILDKATSFQEKQWDFNSKLRKYKNKPQYEQNDVDFFKLIKNYYETTEYEREL